MLQLTLPHYCIVVVVCQNSLKGLLSTILRLYWIDDAVIPRCSYTTMHVTDLGRRIFFIPYISNIILWGLILTCRFRNLLGVSVLIKNRCKTLIKIFHILFYWSLVKFVWNQFWDWNAQHFKRSSNHHFPLYCYRADYTGGNCSIDMFALPVYALLLLAIDLL